MTPATRFSPSEGADSCSARATWSSDMRNMMLLALAIFVVALMILPDRFGNHGLWAALNIFLLVRGLTLLAILPRRMRSL